LSNPGRKPLTKMFKASPLSYFTDNNTGSLYAQQGGQARISHTFGSTSALSTFYNTATNNITVSAANQVTNLYIKHMRARFTFTNQSPGDIKVTLYTVRWRNNTLLSNSPLSLWTGAVITQKFNTISADTTTVGNDPMKFKGFTNEMRVVKRNVINMGAGSHHHHMINFNVNKVFDEQRGSTQTNTKDFTYAVLIVVHGYPVDQSLNLSAAVGVTTAPAKLIYTYEQEASFKLMSAAPALSVYQETDVYPRGNANLYEENPTTDTANQILTAAGVLSGFA
jgi:hypothetical protein